MSRRTAKLERLIAEMLDTFRDLARSHWVRIDLPKWEEHYRRRARRLGVKFNDQAQPQPPRDRNREH